MKLVEMILVPLLSLSILFVLTKLMGYRQVSQLSMYDYIVGITFGSIAAELVMNGFKEISRPIIAMIVYTIFAIILSKIAQTSSKARRIIDGHAVILYENDCLYNSQLQKAKMDIDEFLMQCRIGGYFNLYELDTVILETNGNLSFFPKEKSRPLQVKDINSTVQNVVPPKILIKQGEIHTKNMNRIKKDKEWLEMILKDANISLKDVVLLYQDTTSNIQLFTMNNIKKEYE